MSFLVDTNILSELARREPNPGVLGWAARVTQIALSAVTVEELFFGLTWKPNHRVRSWLASFLKEHSTVLPVSEEIAQLAGALRGERRSRGRQRTQADMLIAATAAHHRLTLVTRNVADFDDCAIALLNPFR